MSISTRARTTPTLGRRARATRTNALRDTGVTRDGLRAAEKQRVVVDVDGVGKVLLQEFANDVYAVSNKCPHLGLSLQGKTPLLSATVDDGTCEFNLITDACSSDLDGDHAVSLSDLLILLTQFGTDCPE